MSQSEIIKLLEKNGEMTCIELAGELNLSFASVWKNLFSLLKNKEVVRINKSKEQVVQEGKHYTGRSVIWKIQN